MNRISTLLLLIVFITVSVYAGVYLDGPWHGYIDINRDRLPLTFDFKTSGDKYEAVFGSPAQSASGIPTEMTVEGDTVRISIPSIGAKFEGVYNEGYIVGAFEQRGFTFMMALEPGALDKPQTPKPPYPYPTREVKFVNPVDSTIFHGTLTFPVQYNLPFFKTFPLVVMVTGSGVQNRDEEIAGHKPFAVIADHLAMNGIASLRYDDRGYLRNLHTGYINDETTYTYASDAEAAVAFVRDSVERVSKIGILGHSEGGTIALMLAGDSKADFIVSLAGMTMRGDSLLVRQNEQMLEMHLPQDVVRDYTEALKRTFKYMEDNPQAYSWPEINENLRDLTALSPEMKDNLNEIIASRVPWLDTFLTLDPTPFISGIKIPVMAINGSADKQVDSSLNLSVLNDLLPPNPKSLVKEYLGMNHLFQYSTSGMPSEYGIIDETIAPEVLRDISTWINSLK